MVTKYGMSEKLGPIQYGTDDSEPFLSRDMGHIRNYSEETASAIDNEIKMLVDDAYHKTERILTEHMDQLHEVAEFLFHNEKMRGEEFRAVMEGTYQYPEEQPQEPASFASDFDTDKH